MKRVLLIFCIVFIPAIAVSAPSITNVTWSGNLNDGIVVTITGTGFGSKSPVAPLVWDDFEDQDFSEWDSAQMSITSVDKHAGTYSARGNLNDASAPHLQFNETLSDSEQLYAFFYRMYACNLGALTANQKYFRMYTSGAYPDWVASYHNGADYLAVDVLVTSNISCPTSDSAEPVANVWRSEEFRRQMSSGSGQADGIENIVFDNDSKCSSSSFVSRNGSYPGNINNIIIDGYGDIAQSCYMYVDDAYIDNTWQRVMLADNSTYSSATHLEIQPPQTTWSNTSIEILFNQGSFSNEDRVYLYVFDTSNNSDSGYELTIGSEAGVSTGGIKGLKIE
jgi:hypothetical protein